MKKTANVFEEKAEGLETVNKRITKNVSENIHKVDNIISSARSTSSLFNIQAIAARIKLRDACERAIMSGSTSYTQRMEEILWRKVYYEPLSTAKKLKKGSPWSEIERGLIWAHLNDGIAFYHHHLMTLSTSATISDHYTADFLPNSYHDDDPTPKKKENDQSLDFFFRSLTCLGDLARYMLDIPTQISNSNAYLLSVRYYHQALHHNSEGGLTHSNLATVYSTNEQPLLAALHYLRAITCEKPFEAAENNLRRMLDKSRIWLENKKMEKEHMKEASLSKESTKFLHSCLALLFCFINNRRTEEIVALCQDVLLLMGKLLDDYDNVDPPDVSEASTDTSTPVNLKGLNGCIDSPLSSKSLIDQLEKKQVHEEEEGATFMLTPESMVTLCALFIICIKRLKMQDSIHCNMSEVLLISILLTLVSHINTRLEQRFALIDPTFIQKLLPSPEQNTKSEDDDSAIKDNQNHDNGICNGDNKNKKNNNKGKRNKLSKLRRKRNKELVPVDNEDSDNEGIDEEDNSCDSIMEREALSSSDEEADEEFDPSVLCSSEEEEESDDDVKIESEEEWEGITEEEHVQLVEQEGMLAAANVIMQWFLDNEDMIKLCGKTAHNLWTSFAKLFNLLKVDYEKLNINETFIHKENLLKRFKDLKRENCLKDDEIKNLMGSLPENLMLHLVIPSFRSSNSSHSFKPSEINLLRLYQMTSSMHRLCNRDDTPLKIKDDKYIICDDKMKTILEKAKVENEKTPEGRSTPSNVIQQQQVLASKEEPTKMEESSQNTPKHMSQITINSKITSSMQSLTAQWLQHEVRNLEEKTSRRMKLGGLYLVPDASVLINHLVAIKQILATPSHMVIIPQAVIESLDHQKRDSLGARDAIRWLEVKLRNGSRFMRVQRPHERVHIPLIKYPKRKDKEAWQWFNLAECCCYLGAQMNKTDSKTSTVTLLTSDTASKTAKRSFSLLTLAEAAGAVLQSVDEFVRKWQISTKGHS